MQNMIQCPSCKHEFSLNELQSHEVEEKIKKELRDQFNKKWVEEKEKLEKTITEDAQKSAQKELEELKVESLEKDKKLEEAREMELKIRKEKLELEEAKRDLDLQMERKLDEERSKIRAKTEEEMSEKQHLREREKDQIIESLRKSLEDAQRKATQGSQQSQGEILELELEEILKREFPMDEIIPVPKGVTGADVMQRVRDQGGRVCGIIIWESKRTKSWTEGWVQKLKDDQRASKSDVAIIVTTVLPEGVKNFEHRDGVYITSFEAFLAVAKLVRLSLSQLHLAKQSSVNKNEKMEVLYQYLSSSDFRNKIEAIVETFTNMKLMLEKEKLVYTKVWASREKQIQRVVDNTVGMYGDLQGLMGASLPEIQSLEVDELTLLDSPEGE